MEPPDDLSERVLREEYVLPREDRVEFSRVVVKRMEATASGIERLAAEGVAAHERLMRKSIPDLVRAERAWVERHTGDLDAALVS